jgi:hypothetical protein
MIELFSKSPALTKYINHLFYFQIDSLTGPQRLQCPTVACLSTKGSKQTAPCPQFYDNTIAKQKIDQLFLGLQEVVEEHMQNTQPLVVAKHQHVVVPGVPRNVPSTVTQHDPPNHPPMVMHASHHNITAGVPRIVALPPSQNPHGQAPFLYHPMMHVEGHPRIEETRSAEDHVALRRKQLLPTPLQGINFLKILK